MQAIKLAETEASAKYSYGWQRAEVLGALINSVFLLALCFSIGMEAIARLINDVGEALSRADTCHLLGASAD